MPDETLLPAVPDNADWLDHWSRADLEPIFYSEDPILWRVLEGMWEQRSLEFLYLGGSTPGEFRKVRPTIVFKKKGFNAVYFSGWCGVRGAERTFRIDHCDFDLIYAATPKLPSFIQSQDP